MQLSSALPFAPGAILLALVSIQVAQPNGFGGSRKSKPGQKTAGMGTGGSTFSSSSSRGRSGAHSTGGHVGSRNMDRNKYHSPIASATAIPRSGHHLPDMRIAQSRGPVKAPTTPNRPQPPNITQSNYRRGPGARKRASKGGDSISAQAADFAMGFLNHDSTVSGAPTNRDLRIPAPFF